MLLGRGHTQGIRKISKQQVLLLERSGFWKFLNSTCRKFNMTIHHFFAWRPLPLEWDSWPLASAIWRPWKAHCFKLTIPSCWTACLQLVPRWKSSWSPKTKKAGGDMVSDGGLWITTRKKRLLHTFGETFLYLQKPIGNYHQLSNGSPNSIKFLRLQQFWRDESLKLKQKTTHLRICGP